MLKRDVSAVKDFSHKQRKALSDFFDVALDGLAHRNAHRLPAAYVGWSGERFVVFMITDSGDVKGVDG